MTLNLERFVAWFSRVNSSTSFHPESSCPIHAQFLIFLLKLSRRQLHLQSFVRMDHSSIASIIAYPSHLAPWWCHQPHALFKFAPLTTGTISISIHHHIPLNLLQSPPISLIRIQHRHILCSTAHRLFHDDFVFFLIFALQGFGLRFLQVSLLSSDFVR